MKVDADWEYYVKLDKCHGYRTKRSDFAKFWRNFNEHMLRERKCFHRDFDRSEFCLPVTYYLLEPWKNFKLCICLMVKFDSW